MKYLLFQFLVIFPILLATPPHLFRDGVPRFKTFEKQIHEVYLGDKVKLSCYALSKSEAAVTWYRNGEVVEPRKIKTNRFRESRKHMTLEIRKVEVSDQGLWTCKVSNQVGSIERNFTVEIIDFCQYFLNLGISQTVVPFECLCEWQLSKIRRSDVDVTKVNEALCAKYLTRYPTKQKKITRMYTTCVNPPCDKYGRPLSLQTASDGMTQNYVASTTPNSLYATSSVSSSAPAYMSFASVPSEMKGMLPISSTLLPPIPSTISSHYFNEPTKNEAIVDETVEEEDTDESVEVRSLEKSTSENTFFSNFSVPPEIVEKAVLRPHQQVHPYFKDSDEQERHVASPAGRTVRLSCKAGGYPEPMVIWHKNDALIVQDSPRGSGSEYRIRKWSLELEDASTDDSGKYVCEIWSEIGTVNRTFHVKIISRMRSPPLIIPNVLVNQTVNVNSTARFRCKVISDLAPHIVWARMIRSENQRSYESSYDSPEKYVYQDLTDFERATIVQDRDESTLLIEHISTDDQGVYACITGNTLGLAMANATLFVNDFMDFEIPTGSVESELTIWWIILIAFVIVSISILVGLGVAYITCITYYKKKHFLENEALIRKRKKIIVTHKTHSNGEWREQPASYQVQVVEQNPPKRKGTRFRLSSELTMLDEYEVSTDQNWEIERDRLQLQEVIGSGAFGEVWKATLRVPPEAGGEELEMPVAVKKVKPSATEKDLVTLVQEMEMFKIIGCHENILRLIGCCSGVGPLYVLLELCEYGNLRDFLRAHRPKDEKLKTGGYTDYLEPRKACYTQKPVIENLTQRHLVQFAFQIAKAMEFMASRKIVHRDLAARNVLVAANFVMKVSDFGLSKDVKYNDYYRKKGKERLPFKWMAIETLDNQISTIESDVWSFGIVMWEIMTLGGTPYPTIAMEQLFTCLKAGYRMEAPHNCPEEIYVLMVTCWQEKRDLRPTFTMIATYLEWMLEQSPNETQALDENDCPQENPSYVNFNADIASDVFQS